MSQLPNTSLKSELPKTALVSTEEDQHRESIKKLSKQAEDTGEAIENLSKLEFAIYTVLALKDVIFNKRFPKAVILANAFESIVEWLTNKMMAGEKEGRPLSKPFEFLGNISAKICRVKNNQGQIVKGSSELLAHRGKVTGALITVINGLGLVNSLKTTYSGFFSHKAHKKEHALLSGFSILAPAVNAVSMILCSILKEAFGKAIERHPAKKKDHELINSLLTGANEDGRCALKSGLAMLIDILDAVGLKSATAIDGIAGLALNIFGLQNGFSSLRGHEEEMGFSLNLMKSFVAKPLYKLGEKFTNMCGVKIPDFNTIKTLQAA